MSILHGLHGPPWAPGYLHRTVDEAPIDFRCKQTPEDFLVEERAAEPPTGSGAHLWLWVEKRGLTTIDAARRLAHALGREPSEAGFAGRKDAHAVTRQWISIEHADPNQARGLELPGLRVLAVERSARKLRVGQLVGNRFTLVLRDVVESARPRIERALSILVERGLPNYVGPQRFGRSGLNHELGALLVAGDDEGYLRAFLSPAHAGPGPAAAELARRIASGTWSERRAAGQLARQLDADRAPIARQLVRRPKHLGWAVRAVPKRTRRFQLSALQAVAFNRVLVARLGEPDGIDALWAGDVARDHAQARTFHVEEACARAPLEWSATGPLPGRGGRTPSGRAAVLEDALARAVGLGPDELAALPPGLAPSGARRPLRVPVERLEVRFEPDRAQLAFDLPSGSFATTLLEELRKEYAPGRSFRPAGSA